jgi:hypothetical protein
MWGVPGSPLQKAASTDPDPSWTEKWAEEYLGSFSLLYKNVSALQY